MTWNEVLTSFKQMYKNLMELNKWTITQIDEMDAHFFFDMMDTQGQEKEVYLSDVW